MSTENFWNEQRAIQDRLERARESFRQDQITEGLRNLARIFEGGDYGYGYVDPRELRAGQKYYTAEGQEFVLPGTFQGYTLGSPESEAYAAGVAAVPRPKNNGVWPVAARGNAPYSAALAPRPAGGVKDMADYLAGVSAVQVPTGLSTTSAPSPKTLGEVYGVGAAGGALGTGTSNPAYWEVAALLPQLYREKRTTTGYDEAYHNRMRDAYLASATPQIEDAYEKARRELAFSLARAGQSVSTTATQRYADLGKDFRLKQQETASSAQDLVGQSKRNVATARRTAEDLLYSSNPTAPEQAAREALSQANALASSGTPNYSPMGVLFQNASAGLAGYADAARYAGMERRIRDEYEGLRAPGESSARTVRT